MYLACGWLWGRMGVAWGWLWCGLGGTLVEPWWSLGGALVEPWWSLGGALGWPWGGFVLRSLCLVYGLVVALWWLWVACSSSSFKVRGSTFEVRRSASDRNIKRRKAACRPSAASLVDITRPGGGWRRSRDSESYPRRVSLPSPRASLAGRGRSPQWQCRDAPRNRANS